MTYFLLFFDIQLTSDCETVKLNTLLECKTAYPNIEKAENGANFDGIRPDYSALTNIIELSKEQYIAAGGEIKGSNDG